MWLRDEDGQYSQSGAHRWDYDTIAVLQGLIDTACMRLMFEENYIYVGDQGVRIIPDPEEYHTA